ncbi:MAG: hypothetical protein QM796_14575 [Chthoniobacteraceae bacterium]
MIESASVRIRMLSVPQLLNATPTQMAWFVEPWRPIPIRQSPPPTERQVSRWQPPSLLHWKRVRRRVGQVILNRPFLTVGELGYVFSDTPWKNLDFSTPESGFAPLLDAFCINDTDNADGVVAGKVNLNTRQAPVLQAILSGAYKDEYGGHAAPLTTVEAQTLATALITRTTTTSKGPLTNLGDLVGKWKSGSGATAVYDGYSADLTSTDVYTNNISRYRESAIRALATAGQTRVWNLMIDVVAQTGRYPQSATTLDKFMVEGEQRYWVHVAIDRLTGNVVDKQIEVVKE